ncbi:hypothetical protein QQ045_021156 [Rhodiola kirilowii]
MTLPANHLRFPVLKSKRLALINFPTDFRALRCKREKGLLEVDHVYIYVESLQFMTLCLKQYQLLHLRLKYFCCLYRFFVSSFEMSSSGRGSKRGIMPVVQHISDVDSGSRSLALIRKEGDAAPIVSSFNDKIRPLLDAIDKLRHLMIMKEGIQLPTIVVVGDQSSGKSSVLESLAGISLPRGQGICTRVPLIMRLQNQASGDTQLFLEFNGKHVQTDEGNIAEAIRNATDEIAGNGKGISNNPLTLVVKKNGVPDLTMVDLPGITRVPVQGQPDDIYEQISNIIREYISPEESIILNVLSAAVDFPTCESIRMSQQVDKSGQRTLAVVTKCDRAPDGLLEKVSTDAVNIGLGYVCVRNRIGDESYEEARVEEAMLFETNPHLRQIDRNIVGIPILAQKLVHLQASIITKRLPEIVNKINEKLSHNMEQLNKMPKNLTSIAEAMTALMQILGSSKESLRKILLRGEFEEYPDDLSMHCTSRLAEMLNQYSDEHQSSDIQGTENFLMEEIKVLEETKGIGLPNFLPRSAFLFLHQRKVNAVSFAPIEFVTKIWNYIEGVVFTVLMHHSDNYPPLQSATRRAVHNMFLKIRERSVARVMETIEMEKLTDYTSNPEYMLEWTKLMQQVDHFMNTVKDHGNNVEKAEGWWVNEVALPAFGNVNVKHLVNYQHVLQQAFDLKMRCTAYWKIVVRRMVDSMALHLLHQINILVDKEMEHEIVNELLGNGGGIERMLEESPMVAGKRERLNKSMRLLMESKGVVENIRDRISAYDA